MQGRELKNCAIIGARGYSGLELSRLLLRHPHAELKACFGSGSNPDWKLSDDLHEESAANVPSLSMKDFNPADYDVVFLATPAETSLEWAPKIIAAGTDCVDLSGAFRLEPTEFVKWYGHARNQNPAEEPLAQYGLVPWCGPARSAKPKCGGARLIANPGCYATSILMALVPILKERLVQSQTLVIDAKSGATGAGRKAAESLLFTEVDGDCLPYRVGKHQHLPEIQKYAREFCGVEIDPIFSTHLLPIRRGILSSIYARLAPGVGAAEITRAFETAYGSQPLVKLHPGKTPGLKIAAGSPRTHLGWTVEGDKLHLFSAIDNLLKGAASQAIENLNRLMDQDPSTGLRGMGDYS